MGSFNSRLAAELAVMPLFAGLTAHQTEEVAGCVIERRVKDLAKLLGIGHLLDRTPKGLSGGERQRVALRGRLRESKRQRVVQRGRLRPAFPRAPASRRTA